MKRKFNKNLLKLFRPEVLEKLENNQFTGRLRVNWRNGKVEYYRLVSSIGFNKTGEEVMEVDPFF